MQPNNDPVGAVLSPPVVLICTITVCLAYLGIVGCFVTLVLILHDGEATTSVVDHLTQIVQYSLMALVVVLTGHQVTRTIAARLGVSAAAPPADSVP